ncbi:dihydroorotase [Solitalea canadensis]|uniref:Dihydroorotase, multifunctional complex type n=1 Tax=Solitalea canadensis (strain ATCC 29591 / DSM 3403 / JCM 21819 / LMG 8368 / NBRC 15130 / NCIMB 12057 / USAM 9D) TaxID=929556 RepID=H8KPC6_SOLCM|nr:dihydroorotase [Solitalea canadensis]AFD05824.1 dihydroorotase, multifunctional complex type [Solitalea canadensis DSM 3403]
MSSILIKNATVVNEGKQFTADVLVKNGFIEKIDSSINETATIEINAAGKYLLPGCIDDQVHFREPGLTHKANIASESAAAVAGGITSYMEMPNTVPNTLTQELLAEKYQIASHSSLANYSFFMGAGNDNMEEVLKTNNKNVCGIKVFMGSSTGNMLVDNEKTLEGIFSQVPMLIATHCEDEATIRNNLERFKQEFTEERITIEMHPLIRSAEACYISSSKAIDLAQKFNTRLHILHISTGIETQLFDNKTPLKDKKITAEACVHHLWFSDQDYKTKGNYIKWNPAVKTAADRAQIFEAVLNDHIDVIATDHAPHTIEEKEQSYLKAPSGGPLVQHALTAMLEFHNQGKISLEKIAEKMAHNVAICFNIEKRGFIREGYWADLVLVDLNNPWSVTKDNILYKCGWSPFEGQEFSAKVTHTIVSGNLAYENGRLNHTNKGQRLLFDRN